MRMRFAQVNGVVSSFLHHYIATQFVINDTQLNELGDKYLVAGICGADISVQRADELDEACVHFAHLSKLRGYDVHALDIGGGIGAQSLRLAAVGAKATLVDITDQGQSVILPKFSARIDNQSLVEGSARFIAGDIRELVTASSLGLDRSYEIVYSQRMWSSIPYNDALEVLQKLTTDGGCSPDAVFFVSAIGLYSEIGENYPHRNKQVRDRWSLYDQVMAHKHGVHGHECLYSENDLVHQFQAAGLRVIHRWTSSFGNPKIIAIHPKASNDARASLRFILNAVKVNN